MRARQLMMAGLAVAATTLSGCEKPKELTVANARIRLAATSKAPAVAYFTVTGGPKADRLLMVTSPLVIRAELHESMTAGQMAMMKPLRDGVDIPANTTVKFEQGGKHLMLFDLNPSIKPGDTVQMNFTFTSGLTMQAYAPVKAAGQVL